MRQANLVLFKYYHRAEGSQLRIKTFNALEFAQIYKRDILYLMELKCSQGLDELQQRHGKEMVVLFKVIIFMLITSEIYFTVFSQHFH